MSLMMVRRRPRRPGPEMPQGELVLQEPPAVAEPSSGMSNMIMYMPMALGSMSMGVIFLRPGGGGGGITYVAIGLMAVSAVGMVVSQLVRATGDRKRKMRGERRDYLRNLAQVRRQARRHTAAQQRAQAWLHPEPASLWSLVRTDRLWERRRGHPDFAEIRVGAGPQQLAVTINPLSTRPVEDLEPLSAHALRRFIRAYATVEDQPIAVYLPGFARVTLTGPPEVARAMVRAVLGQLAALHAPTDLCIAVVTDEDARDRWEWTRWLPHALHPSEVDGAGGVRLVADSAGRLEQILGEELAGRPAWTPDPPDPQDAVDEPFTVIVVDSAEALGGRLGGGGYRNAVVVDVRGSGGRGQVEDTLLLDLAADRLDLLSVERDGARTVESLGRPDAMSEVGVEALARQLAPFRLQDDASGGEPLSTDIELTTLLGIADLHTMDVDALWRQRTTSDRLDIPLGLGADGLPVALDIKESAQGGMGPHGLLIGATGSGKSELLRTMVLALALTHSSETLNFVLTDFKGGATFLGLDKLPHTSAVITNLVDEESLVDRMKDALNGEMIRRQELLRAAGNYSSALEYETARAAGTPLAPLPSLLVIVDEFSELLAAHRDFMELFVMIGRLGRSLGVHLLLASQRLDEGRMSQLESHLSYRIGLRTFSAMESRGVLGVPDAYQLPTAPGNGYLKSDTATLTRFKASYVSGEYRTVRRIRATAQLADQVVRYGTAHVPVREVPVEPSDSEAVPDETADSLLGTAVGRLIDAGPPAHRVWLAPLDESPALDELLPPLLPDAAFGLTTVGSPLRGSLQVPVGLVDRPFEQTRDLLAADLSGAGGHVGIVGGPQSGKSSLVRTLLAALALTHTPREVQFYCLDFGGGALSGLADLPHVGEVTGRLDPDRMARLITEVNNVIVTRERFFAENRIASFAEYRTRHRAGEFPDDPFGDVFLVVDGWSTVKQDFMDLIPVFGLIASRGLNFGVHLIVAATRWGEITTSLRDQLGTRFELRLGDPVDSAINMRAAAGVPRIPGRGLTETQLHFVTGLPRIDGSAGSADLSAGVADLVETVSAAWSGPQAPPVRMLPLKVPAASLPLVEDALRIPLGVEETRLAPFVHDFEATPHLLVLGDSETGKTNLLSLVARSVAANSTAAQARVSLIDVRRQLFDAVPEETRLGYGVSVDAVREIVAGIADAMRTRLPGPEITPAQLQRRDWWKGPTLFLLVDDFDLVSTSSGPSPFTPLLEFLAQGTELGLHLVVARSANGAARAMGDPLLRRLVEVNTPTLLMSCPPSEGFIIGNVKPRTLPPGRALHITRRGAVLVQTAEVPAPVGAAV